MRAGQLAERDPTPTRNVAELNCPFPRACHHLEPRSRRLLPSLCFAAFFLLQLVAEYGFSAETAGSADPLAQAQIENQKAQARYYSRQSDKRGFWRSLREFGWPAGAIAAGVAAIVAVGLNQRANLRFRSDTEFYETIKLFSQKENPTSRLMAAGLLAQMAARRNRFYECAFDQLAVAILTEPESQVQDAIRLALGRLVKENPGKSLQKLEAMNRGLRTAVSELLYRFFLAGGEDLLTEIPENDWIQAEKITEFDRQTLNALLDSIPKDHVAQVLNSARRAARTNNCETDDPYKESTRTALAKAAELLRSNVKSISESLFCLRDAAGFLGRMFSDRKKTPHSFFSTFLAGGEFRDLESWHICRAVLRNANLAAATLKRASLFETDLSKADMSYAKLSFVHCKGTKLTGAILRYADLRGAKIQNCDFSGADLSGAIFRDTVIAPGAFQGTEWWKADFSRQRNLLKAVYANLKKELPDLEHLYVRGEIHQSVLDFIGKVTEERL
jgi:uncharacterized protein YjbI with pentapeptide repeats